MHIIKCLNLFFINFKTNYRIRLPHIQPVGALYFVTFRLGDSLPQPIFKKMKDEMEQNILKIKKEFPRNFKEKVNIEKKRFFGKFEHQLDSHPYGNCYLKRPDVAAIVSEKLQEYDGVHYELCAYCIMPNHVHVLFDFTPQVLHKDLTYMDEVPETYLPLCKVMQLIKGGSSFSINRLLGRKGTLWQRDYFDYYVRNHKEFNNILIYILENPVKAGFVKEREHWPFSFVKAW